MSAADARVACASTSSGSRVNDHLSFLLADALERPMALPELGGGAWQLPPIASTGQLTPATLVTIGKGYLFAELETAALIACADAVAEARSNLRASLALASRIESYVELQRRCPTALEREAFFVRWFGLGRHAAIDDHGNHSFFPRMSDLCGALGSLATSGIGAPPRSFSEERSRAALERLLGELALRAGGDLLIISRIEALASAGVAILADPELAALIGTTGLAGVVRTLVGGVAMDLATAYQRGRSGQAVLEDCARLMPRVTSQSGAFIDPSDPAVLHAVQWLASYGIRGTGGGGLA
jgi:hypothetical protein